MNPLQQQMIPRDIKGLVNDLGFWWWPHLLFILLIVALVVAAIFYYLKKKNKKSQSSSVIEENRSDKVRALIFALTPQEPFSQEQRESFFYELSLLFREFIELKTGVFATDKTLQELKAPLREKLPLSQEALSEVINFLSVSDMIKFAERQSSSEEAASFKTKVEAWVRKLDEVSV
jgi:hypothetical protein